MSGDGSGEEHEERSAPAKNPLEDPAFVERHGLSPAQETAPAGSRTPAEDPAEHVLERRRCWRRRSGAREPCTSPDDFLGPDASEEILAVTLSAVLREEERDGYAQRLEAFAEQHRERLEEMLRAHGPGSALAEHGQYALVGRPEALVIYERMETNPFALRRR